MRWRKGSLNVLVAAMSTRPPLATEWPHLPSRNANYCSIFTAAASHANAGCSRIGASRVRGRGVPATGVAKALAAPACASLVGWPRPYSTYERGLLRPRPVPGSWLRAHKDIDTALDDLLRQGASTCPDGAPPAPSPHPPALPQSQPSLPPTSPPGTHSHHSNNSSHKVHPSRKWTLAAADDLLHHLASLGRLDDTMAALTACVRNDTVSPRACSLVLCGLAKGGRARDALAAIPWLEEASDRGRGGRSLADGREFAGSGGGSSWVTDDGSLFAGERGVGAWVADRHFYASLVNGCAEAGDFEGACAVVGHMRARGMEPTLSVLGALLKACGSFKRPGRGVSGVRELPQSRGGDGDGGRGGEVTGGRGHERHDMEGDAERIIGGDARVVVRGCAGAPGVGAGADADASMGITRDVDTLLVARNGQPGADGGEQGTWDGPQGVAVGSAEMVARDGSDGTIPHGSDRALPRSLNAFVIRQEELLHRLATAGETLEAMLALARRVGGRVGVAGLVTFASLCAHVGDAGQALRALRWAGLAGAGEEKQRGLWEGGYAEAEGRGLGEGARVLSKGRRDLTDSMAGSRSETAHLSQTTGATFLPLNGQASDNGLALSDGQAHETGPHRQTVQALPNGRPHPHLTLWAAVLGACVRARDLPRAAETVLEMGRRTLVGGRPKRDARGGGGEGEARLGGGDSSVEGSAGLAMPSEQHGQRWLGVERGFREPGLSYLQELVAAFWLNEEPVQDSKKEAPKEDFPPQERLFPAAVHDSGARNDCEDILGSNDKNGCYDILDSNDKHFEDILDVVLGRPGWLQQLPTPRYHELCLAAVALAASKAGAPGSLATYAWLRMRRPSLGEHALALLVDVALRGPTGEGKGEGGGGGRGERNAREAACGVRIARLLAEDMRHQGIQVGPALSRIAQLA